MTSWQKLIKSILLKFLQFLHNPRRSPRIIRQLGIFFIVILLVIVQNSWLLLTPVAAQSSTLLRVTNQFLTPIVAPGGVSILRIQINNDGATSLTNLSFSNSFVSVPGAMIIAAAPAITNNCGGSIASVSGSFPGTPGSISLSNGSIPPGSFCQIDIPVQAFSSGNYISTINAKAVTSATLSNNDPTSATLQILSSSPATLAKAFSPNTIPGDGRSRVTVTITNPNTFAITGNSVALTDTLPANVLVDTRPGAITPTTICAGGVVNILTGNSGVALGGGTIPANGNCTITFDVTSSIGSSYTNTISANALSTVNRVSNSNTVNATLNVQTQVNITKAFGTSTLAEEKVTSLTITISNGGGALTNAALTDSLPSPLVIANITASTNCTPSGASQVLTVTANATSFTLNNTNTAGGAAQVPGSNPATNALGTCTVTVNVKPAGGTIGNLGAGPTLAITNTILANSLGNKEGRTNATAATAPMTVQSGLVATKTYSNSLAPGSTSRIRIRVNNRSGVIATGVGYNDDLPAGLIVANPPVVTITGCGVGTISPTLFSGATSVNLSGATIALGGNCDVSFDVTSNAAVGNNFDNVIANNAITNGQGLDSDGVTGTEGRVTVASRVTVGKTFNPTSVRRGLSSLLTISITNNRRSLLGVAEPLTNIAIKDNLPANLQVANPTGFVSNCGGTVSGNTVGSTSWSLVGGSIAAVSSCSISLNVIEIDQTQTNFPTPFIYSNTPTAFSNAEGEGATLPTATLTVISPLASSKVFQSASIAANGVAAAVITLNNSLPIGLTNTTFNDSWIQTNTTIANPPNASTTCVGGIVSAIAGTKTVSITNANIPSQVSGVSGLCTVRFDVTMTGSGSANFVNTIQAGGITTAEGFSNPVAISGTLVRAVSAVTVVKSLNLANIDFGQPSTLTVAVTNPSGGISLTNMGFVDDMANPTAGMLIYSVPNSTNNCGGTVTANPGASTFTLSGASINAGSSCSVSLQVTLSTTGNRTNTLPIGAITSREGVSNTSATSASLSASPAINLTKVFAPASIAINTRSTLTITVTNKTSSQITSLTATDPLPVNLVVANPTFAATTCPSGTVNPLAGDTSILLTGATLAANASCQITVRVISSLADTYVNTIPIGNVTAAGGIANHLAATATLIVSKSPQLLLVKRITRINTTQLTNVVNDPDTTDDNNPGWPVGYLQGEIMFPNVQSNDLVEYTIYFLNGNLSSAKNVRICDRLTSNQTYISNSFNGLTPTDGGTGNVLGMALAIGSTTPTNYLTNINDPPDRGQFVGTSATPIPSNCGTSSLTNVNGLVIVDVTRSPDLPSLANSNGTGKPPTSYGYVRFRTVVN